MALNNEYSHFLGTIKVEDQILLLSSRFSMTKEQAQLLHDNCRKKPDWTHVLSQAQIHSVFPFLYKHLRNHLQNLLPDEEYQKYQLRFKRLCARNILMTAALEKCICALQEQGIKALPFKGPVLAALYGDLSLRQFGDIDILVDRTDVSNAVDVLGGLGFSPLAILSSAQLEKLCQTDNEFPLYHYKTGLMLDLQWELTGGYFKEELKMCDLIEDLVPIKLIRMNVQTFVNESLLLYLCIHGNQHVWQRLDNVCCINETLRANPALNWDVVISRAKSLGAYRMLCIGVLLAHKLLDSQIPLEVLQEIKREKCAVKMVRELYRRIFPSCHGKQGIEHVSHRFDFYHFKSLDSKWGALKYACHLVFVPTRYDWTLFQLPAMLSFLYYFFRPFRMLYQWARSISLKNRK